MTPGVLKGYFQPDIYHTDVFAKGSVAHVAEVFEATLAPVAEREKELGSAMSAPSLRETFWSYDRRMNALLDNLFADRGIFPCQQVAANGDQFHLNP